MSPKEAGEAGSESRWDGLPATLSHADARAAGVSDREFYRLRDSGALEVIGHGLYRRRGAAPTDVDLLEISHRADRATLCLASALARHGLTDENPVAIDIALPRGQYQPILSAPVAWHSFDRGTFDVGREEVPLDRESAIGLYGAERTLIDVFRLRHQEGREIAYTALRRWLGRRGASPGRLMAMARGFPHAEPALRTALEVLQ